MSQGIIAAADIGGTKVLAVGATPQGAILSQTTLPSQAQGGGEAVVQSLFSALRQALAQAGGLGQGLAGIGIACAGLIEPNQGTVVTSPNLPGFTRFPLRERVETEFGVPVVIANDANAAALGEYYYGAGRGCRYLVYITVSTGIGGGLVLNGELYTGAWGVAGEVGHITIDPQGPPCACGNRGCLEALASGSALAREARLRLVQGEKSLLLSLSQGDPQKISARLIHQAARQGDELSLKLIAQAGEYLGIGLANLINLLNPEVIVVGGGVSQMGELLLTPAREEIKKRAFPFAAQGVKLLLSELGDQAGVKGMVALVVGGGAGPGPALPP